LKTDLIYDYDWFWAGAKEKKIHGGQTIPRRPWKHENAQ
jgi:hypothetical protein